MEVQVLNEVELLEGKPFPLGATLTPDGANFAIFSEHATKVTLVFFDKAGDEKPASTRVLKDRTGPIWHGFLKGVKAGQLYGYRIEGPYNPEEAHRFNPHKVLLDPYAKTIGRSLTWDDSLFGYHVGSPQEDLDFSDRDSAPYAPLGEVIDPQFEWTDANRPNIHWRDTIIYEAHVKGITQRHPDVPEELRGRYLGVASDPIIDHLHRLGVTSVQLLPVHAFLQDRHLVQKGLTNYWGYNTLNFFSPEPTYASAPDRAVEEFKQMVDRLHNAGFEVLLDVVYNHTAEGNRLGPTLSFRGVDNLSYYKESPQSSRYYMDFTGTGNTLDMGNPHVLQMVMDSLRYWATEMHVDGFRFDLASVLARKLYEVDMLSPFFQVIQQDPVLSQVKLIAEPWDVGMGGYQVGGFPWQWAEWNGRYRDSVRSFWTNMNGATLGELAKRLAGSADMYNHSGRRPFASVNFLTAHDGFTLEDLVSYEHKHNDANGEDNRDGHDDNRSCNCGVEGPTDDPGILAARERMKRSLFATMVLSQGIPMILGGDELSRTQQGNNNTYCQDNELNWYDWDLDERKQSFLDFARQVVAFRKSNESFHRRHFLTGAAGPSGLEDVSWWHPEGRPLNEDDWDHSYQRAMGMLLSGESVDARDEKGNAVDYTSYLVLFNANGEMNFRLPDLPQIARWRVNLATQPEEVQGETFEGGAEFPLPPACVVVLEAEPA